MPCASIFDAKDAGLNIFRKVQLVLGLAGVNHLVLLSLKFLV